MIAAAGQEFAIRRKLQRGNRACVPSERSVELITGLRHNGKSCNVERGQRVVSHLVSEDNDRRIDALSSATSPGQDSKPAVV